MTWARFESSHSDARHGSAGLKIQSSGQESVESFQHYVSPGVHRATFPNTGRLQDCHGVCICHIRQANFGWLRNNGGNLSVRLRTKAVQTAFSGRDKQLSVGSHHACGSPVNPGSPRNACWLFCGWWIECGHFASTGGIEPPTGFDHRLIVDEGCRPPRVVRVFPARLVPASDHLVETS